MLAIAFLPGRVDAEVIGVGLNWQKNIFVQEFWRDGAPLIAIANKSEQPASLTAHDRRTGNQLAGPWGVEVGAVVVTPIDALKGHDLIELRNGDDSLGLINAPVAPKELGNGPAVRSNYGLNGSGGRQAELMVEQDRTSFPPGEVAEIKLLLPADAGEILFKTDKNPIEAIACESLPIKQEPGKYTILANKPKQKLPQHVVTIRLKMPEVESPTMIVLDGWRWTIPGRAGHGITRGLIVAPRK